WTRIRTIYRVFGPYIHPYARQQVLAYAALALSVIAAALKPWPLKYILDCVILRKQSLHEALPWLPNWIDSVDPHWLVLMLCAMLIAIVMVESTAGYFQKLLFARVGHSATTDVLELTFTHLQTLPRGARSARSGDLIVRLTSDVKTIRDLLVEHQQKLMTYGFTFVITVAIMARLNWQLTLLGLAVVPIIWVVSWRFARSIRTAVRQKRSREGAVASVVHEDLSGLAVIQAFAREEEERRRFRVQAQESLEANVESSRLGGAFNRAVEVLSTIGTALVVGFGAVQVLDGRLSPGDLVVFAAYVNDLYKPIQNLSELSVKFMDSLVSGERVLEVLETAPRVRDFRGAVFAPRFRGEIVFDRVTFGYQYGSPVVQDLSFRIAPGENVGLIGESGSGKSTILSLLLRFHDPWQGRILIDGNDIRNYKVQSLRDQIGVVLQESFLFRRSVFENIQYGKNGATRREILAAAEAAQADGFIKRLPLGYDTVLDELGSNLSGGQRQRIALARAFLRDAPILILDEPTSGLDNATEAELVQTLNDLARRKTTITVAHRLSTLEFCDRVFVLDRGKIVQQMSPRNRKIL
ncbi:MAG TPA: ABC transporter ATP-binding protein, partial [Verrucomicrobiae bacterium]|nr:ABC transporter ATP-binding protein [Verrucomicrobiae bacterium]